MFLTSDLDMSEQLASLFEQLTIHPLPYFTITLSIIYKVYCFLIHKIIPRIARIKR